MIVIGADSTMEDVVPGVGCYISCQKVEHIPFALQDGPHLDCNQYNRDSIQQEWQQFSLRACQVSRL